MYSLAAYGRMISDQVRARAYEGALRRCVTSHSAVLDLGAGIGWMAVMAARLGARCVYAIETSPLIAFGPRIATDSGVGDRVRFIQASSLEVELPEPVDVLVSDLRGLLPFAGNGLYVLVDARRRHLRPGGCLIPLRDELIGALVEAPELYRENAEPWVESACGVVLSSVLDQSMNSIIKGSVRPEQLLHRPQVWGCLDYGTLEEVSLSGALTGAVERPGTAHGISLWFRTRLLDDIGFETSPETGATVYGAAFLPLREAVTLDPTDRFSVQLRADRVGDNYVYGWRSRFFHQNTRSPFASFDQSTFYAEPLDAQALSQRSADFRATLSPGRRADLFVLGRMNGKRSNAEIAQSLAMGYPALYPDLDAALDRVCTLVANWSERVDSGTGQNPGESGKGIRNAL